MTAEQFEDLVSTGIVTITQEMTREEAQRRYPNLTVREAELRYPELNAEVPDADGYTTAMSIQVEQDHRAGMMRRISDAMLEARKK